MKHLNVHSSFLVNNVFFHLIMRMYVMKLILLIFGTFCLSPLKPSRVLESLQPVDEVAEEVPREGDAT